MAQRKILLDTCVYLRLGKSIHPLLQVEFGEDNYCLYVIPQLGEEYGHQPRLQEKHPWVMEDQYRLNRKGRIVLSRKQKTMYSSLLLTLDTSSREQDIDLSHTDIEALATALVAEIPLATDDTGLQELGLILGVETMTTLTLLALMLEHGRIDEGKVRQVLEYLEALPDKPASFAYERNRYFPWC